MDQQRTAGWFAARRGKLTASNLGALLGQVSYTSRAEAYRRALGIDTFTGNEATEWGVNNEMNGIKEYMTCTGYIVTATGLHVHPYYDWLAGSPDGLVGDDGIVEIKCPYYYKRGCVSRVHTRVPGHYWMQMNALMEITQREWCHYVSWTPEGMAIFMVMRDTPTFQYLLQHYAVIAAAIQCGSTKVPPMDKKVREEIQSIVADAIKRGVTFENSFKRYTPPSREESDDDVQPEDEVRRKRKFVSETGDAQDESDETTSVDSATDGDQCDPDKPQYAQESISQVQHADISLQTTAGEV